jgi:hypothetical protein
VKIDDGGQAFPRANGPEASDGYGYEGMSLRDWFAGQVLAGFAHRAFGVGDTGPYHASMAYAWADAMLAERKKGNS